MQRHYQMPKIGQSINKLLTWQVSGQVLPLQNQLSKGLMNQSMLFYGRDTTSQLTEGINVAV